MKEELAAGGGALHGPQGEGPVHHGNAGGGLQVRIFVQSCVQMSSLMIRVRIIIRIIMLL
jgi:hypothetical protein